MLGKLQRLLERCLQAEQSDMKQLIMIIHFLSNIMGSGAEYIHKILRETSLLKAMKHIATNFSQLSDQLADALAWCCKDRLDQLCLGSDDKDGTNNEIVESVIAVCNRVIKCSETRLTVNQVIKVMELIASQGQAQWIAKLATHDNITCLMKQLESQMAEDYSGALSCLSALFVSEDDSIIERAIFEGFLPRVL